MQYLKIKSARAKKTFGILVVLATVMTTCNPLSKSAQALSVVQLTVPYHKQEHKLSCEVASLQMALNAVGVEISESSLIQQLYFDPTPKRNGIWGDPDIGFVGSIDGSMLKTGYGVYAPPIAKLGLRYRRTQILTTNTLQELTAHIDAGHPVIVWGHYGTHGTTSWKTPQGKIIQGVTGEHARVLIGYIGPASYPQVVILLDPAYGQLVLPWDEFYKNWQSLNFNAVAVFKQPQWVKTADSPAIWEIDTDEATKHGLALSWEGFLARGGFGEAINIITQSELEKFTEGSIIQATPLP